MNRVFLLFVASVVVAASPIQEPSVPTSLDRVIDDYRRGDAEQALAEFKKWDAKRMAAEYGAWDSRRIAANHSRPVSTDAPDIAALVMLNTLAALDLDEFGVSGAPVTGKPSHYLAALTLVKALSLTQSRAQPEAGPRASDTEIHTFCRNWYVLAATLWLSGSQCFQAAKTAQDGLTMLGPDAELLLVAGSVAESQMGPFARGAEIEPACGEQWGSSELSLHGDLLIHTRTLRNAEGFLERAVAIDPALAEAHLRLGRVWYWASRPGEARRELEGALSVMTKADRPFVGYLAALFLGRLHEEAHDVDAARRAYEHAIELNPRGRAAHLALGHLLIVSGVPDDGWGRVRETLTDNMGAASDDVDPWLNYRNAQRWRASSRLRALEDWVRR